MGSREVAEAVNLSPAGRIGSSLGPSTSRVWFPGVAGEAMAPAVLWNKSFQALPRLVGVPLRRRRRACGGGASCVQPQYRSRWPANLHLRERDEGADLLVQGCRGSCGCCGWQEDGSSSTFPRRRVRSMAGSDPWSAELGVCPRPMVPLRLLHPVPGVGCLLRLLSKPCCDGALPDLEAISPGLAISRRRQCPAAAISGGFGNGKHRDQGPSCNFFFL
ncbi:unnamed protein product [Urochloa humidicola]